MVTNSQCIIGKVNASSIIGNLLRANIQASLAIIANLDADIASQTVRLCLGNDSVYIKLIGTGSITIGRS